MGAVPAEPKQRFRAFARRTVRLAAIVVHPDQGWQRDVIVFDLGLGGACIEGPDALAVGDKVHVSFVTADRWDPLRIGARIAWTGYGISGPRAGIAFEYPSPEAAWGIFELLLRK